MLSSLICGVSLSSSFFRSKVNFEVRFEPFANLTYQLDVISNQLPWESSQSYRQLWKKIFFVGPEDRKMVDLWEAARQKIQSISEPEGKEEWPIEHAAATLDIETKVRAAGFDSKDSKSFEINLRKFLDPGTAVKLAKVTAHFEKKFSSWWIREPELQGKAFRDDLVALLGKPQVVSCLDQIENFYQPNFKEPVTLPFVLMYKPRLVENEPTSGQQLFKHAVVQFEPGERVETRIDVVVHEYCHFLYQSGSRENLVALQNRFLSQSGKEVIPAYSLLNEGLATVLGNGIFAEILSDPVRFEEKKAVRLSWYGKDGIDRTAKAIFPWMKDLLRSSGSLYDSNFVYRYFESLKKEFGANLLSPTYFLTSVRVIVDESLGADVFGYVRRDLQPAGMFSELDRLNSKSVRKALSRSPHLSGVVVIRRAQWEEFAREFRIETGGKVPDTGFTYCWFPSERRTPVYFVVGKEKSEVERQVLMISKLKLVRTGLL